MVENFSVFTKWLISHFHFNIYKTATTSEDDDCDGGADNDDDIITKYLDLWGPIYKISYDNLTIILR